MTLQAIRSSDSSHPGYGIVIRDVLKLVSGFSFCSFSHLKWQGNLVAHCLAKSSKSGCELQVWQNSIPNNITPIVTRDSL